MNTRKISGRRCPPASLRAMLLNFNGSADKVNTATITPMTPPLPATVRLLMVPFSKDLSTSTGFLCLNSRQIAKITSVEINADLHGERPVMINTKIIINGISRIPSFFSSGQIFGTSSLSTGLMLSL